MFSSFTTALSALNANSTAIDVTSNNLANMSTAGFKTSSVAFHDLVSQATAGNPTGLEIGAGVGGLTTRRNFSQGSIQESGHSFDAAIKGTGFFVVNDGQGQTLFTRSGTFGLDSDGLLLTSSGERVQGWNVVNGTVNPSGATQDIVIPSEGLLAPVATTEFSLAMNLDASAEIGDTFSAPISVVDSLGETHVVTIQLTKSSATDWDYDVTIPGEDLTGGTAGTPSSLVTGTLTFDGNGVLSTPAVADGPIQIAGAGLANGASDLAIDWNVFGANSQPLVSQYSASSALSSTIQDGSAAAELVDVGIQDNGLVVASYSNGSEVVVAQLALANISNPESMVSSGGNNFKLTAASGTPAIGAANSGGRGQIVGGALESSTVDIAQEFTNLIQYQRAYQASSRVITTVDEISQETLNLKR